MKLKTFHVYLLGFGVLGAGVYGLMAPASAQAPQGPAPGTARTGSYPATAFSAPTQMQSVLETPGRTALIEEYRVGETQAPGAVANAEEAPFAPPTRVRFSAAVVCERGREDQRHKGMKITFERPGDRGQIEEIVCFVDRGEMQPLASALTQLADTATRRDGGREVGRDFVRDGGRDGGREVGRDFGRDARDRRRERPTARSASFATADFAVVVRSEGGRPTVEVWNPNRRDSRVTVGADGSTAVLDQWADWIQSAHLLLERK